MAKLPVVAISKKKSKKTSPRNQPKITSYFKKAVKQVMKTVSEPKHLINSKAFSPSNNAWNFFNLTYHITQGDTAFTRDGDRIHLDALKLVYRFYNNAGQKNAQTVRVVVYTSADYGTNTLGVWNTGTGQPRGMIGTDISDYIFESKGQRILYDKSMDIVPTVFDSVNLNYNQNHRMIKELIKLDTDFQYNPNSFQGSTRNLYVAVGVTANGGSASGTFICTTDLIFKDLD